MLLGKSPSLRMSSSLSSQPGLGRLSSSRNNRSNSNSFPSSSRNNHSSSNSFPSSFSSQGNESSAFFTLTSSPAKITIICYTTRITEPSEVSRSRKLPQRLPAVRCSTRPPSIPTPPSLLSSTKNRPVTCFCKGNIYLQRIQDAKAVE